MRIGVLGINYKSAKSLTLREKISEACRHMQGPNTIILSTCHRTEIYFSHDDLALMQSELFSELKKQVPHFEEHVFYSFFGIECFFHLNYVTAGLDSAMLAESDIQRQVKLSYEETRLKQPLSSELHYLFQKALKIGKSVRSSFSLFHTTLHIEGMIYQLIETLLGSSAKLLFLGNSDINRKIIHYFWRKNHRQMTLCTRSLAEAHPFALDYQLTLKDRSELDHWSTYDVVIAATNADKYLISSLPTNGKTRLILDLSVPRSVDPALQRHPELTLLNIEEIGAFFENLNQQRQSEVLSIKNFLQHSAIRYAALYEKKSLYNQKIHY